MFLLFIYPYVFVLCRTFSCNLNLSYVFNVEVGMIIGYKF